MAPTLWSKFFWSDWLSDPGVRRSSYAARGLWMDMLSIAARSDPIGKLCINGDPLTATDIARMTGGAVPEVEILIAELERNGVFSRDRNGVIYSRRMMRDAKKAATARKNGKLGGNPSLRKQKDIPPSDNPPDKGGDNTHIPDTNYQEEIYPSKRALQTEFDEWWLAYPRKVGKGEARTAYLKARKKADAGVLLEGVRRYAAEVAGRDAKFIKHPGPWLNAERWLDEPAARPPPAPSRPRRLTVDEHPDFQSWGNA